MSKVIERARRFFSTLPVRVETWFHHLKVHSNWKHAWRIRSAERVLLRLPSIPLPGQKFAYLRKLDAGTFEEIVLTALEVRGYVAKRNDRYTGDGGIDGRVWHEKYGWGGTQCKRYAGAIKSSHLTAFVADLRRANLGYGIFVHTGKTPASVDRRALRSGPVPIEIISGQRLLDLMDGAR